MPQQLTDILGRTRSYLEEVGTNPRFWTDTELTNWINDGLRDMARRAEDLLTFDTTITTTPGTAKYTMPTDVIRVHRMEFVPTGAGSPQTYPLEAREYQEMDQIWGIWQLNPSSYPSFYCLWGYPGGTGRSLFQVQFYPVPDVAGTINLYYYRLPYRFLDPIANPGELTKSAECVEGWDDAIVKYATFNAMIKDKDPQWQTMKAEYEGLMDYLVNVTRKFHDQQGQIMTASRNASMAWLYNFEY